MEQGWVYVLVNSSIPGVSKVGRTSRPPLQRAAELSAATGVATPFVLAFEQEFADCVLAERLIHAELDRRGWRLTANREFFRGSPGEIVRVVLDVAAASGDGPAPPHVAGAEALLAEADRHLFGQGDTLQDLTEAMRCYRLAAARGSLVALERLGAIHAQLDPRGRIGRRRAMRFLKDGARLGNYYCYVEMAELFAQERHLENFRKAWDKFFAARETMRCAEVEEGHERFALALRRYIGNCLALAEVPGHLSEMMPEAEVLERSVLAALDAVRDAPEARETLMAVLRWTQAALLPGAAVVAPERVRRRVGAWLVRARGVAA